MIQKAYEVIAEQLLKLIIEQPLPIGSRLESVEKLAHRFGVGRSTIREALMSLKAQGWIDVRHGGGTFVLKNSQAAPVAAPEIQNVAQLREWLELRYILETESAALAAVRRSETQLAVLHVIVERMMQQTDEEELEQTDIRFHMAVAQASGNSMLEQALANLFLSIGTVMKESRKLWLFAEQSEAVQLSRDHQSIVNAIQKRDPSLAKERMASHLRKVEQMLEQIKL